VTAEDRKFQFYGRRKGKPLRRHHSSLVDDLLPRLSLDLADPLSLSPAPRWLEIGFGGGEHLAHQATLNPGVSIIGAEPFLNGIAKLLGEIEKRSLRNVRVHGDDARYLLEALPAASFARVYLLYPDPWPKLRHNKRRFVSPDNMAQIARILEPGGSFLFASDIADYVAWTIDMVAAMPEFRLAANSAEPFQNWLQTRYETKARREGRPSRYLAFVRS
jgi:tRNA (guanine-N7-)-methyltransferase